jgi:hypothetical protein
MNPHRDRNKAKQIDNAELRLRQFIRIPIVQKDRVSLALLGIFDRPRRAQPTDVQRLFSMFPSGPPGIALLFLRVSVAFPVLLHCYARRDAMAVMVLAIVFLLAIAVIVGFVTPVVAFMVTAVQLGGPWDLGVSSTGFFTISILNALALMLLGPGAYSLDALRFGRRVVDLPSGGDK